MPTSSAIHLEDKMRDRALAYIERGLAILACGLSAEHLPELIATRRARPWLDLAKRFRGVLEADDRGERADPWPCIEALASTNLLSRRQYSITVEQPSGPDAIEVEQSEACRELRASTAHLLNEREKAGPLLDFNSEKFETTGRQSVIFLQIDGTRPSVQSFTSFERTSEPSGLIRFTENFDMGRKRELVLAPEKFRVLTQEEVRQLPGNEKVVLPYRIDPDLIATSGSQRPASHAVVVLGPLLLDTAETISYGVDLTKDDLEHGLSVEGKAMALLRTFALGGGYGGPAVSMVGFKESDPIEFIARQQSRSPFEFAPSVLAQRRMEMSRLIRERFGRILEENPSVAILAEPSAGQVLFSVDVAQPKGAITKKQFEDVYAEAVKVFPNGLLESSRIERGHTLGAGEEVVAPATHPALRLNDFGTGALTLDYQLPATSLDELDAPKVRRLVTTLDAAGKYFSTHLKNLTRPPLTIQEVEKPRSPFMPPSPSEMAAAGDFHAVEGPTRNPYPSVGAL
jgi:hypothetical protein